MLYYPCKLVKGVPVIIMKPKTCAVVMITALLAFVITGCGNSGEVVLDDNYLIVEEPFAIPICALKSHTKDYIETKKLIKKTYEANSKKAFDRIVRKFDIGDPSGENKLAQFDGSFFINNKVYIVLSNYKWHSSGEIVKMEITKDGDTLNVVLADVARPFPGLPKLFDGVLVAVNKEYAKDIKTVNTSRDAAG